MFAMFVYYGYTYYMYSAFKIHQIIFLMMVSYIGYKLGIGEAKKQEFP